MFLKSGVARGECFRHSNRRNFLCGKFNIDFLWLDGNFGTARDGFITAHNGVGGKVMFSVASVCLFTGEVPMVPLMDLLKLVHLGTPPQQPQLPHHTVTHPLDIFELVHLNLVIQAPTDWNRVIGKRVAGLRLKGLLVFFN